MAALLAATSKSPSTVAACDCATKGAVDRVAGMGRVRLRLGSLLSSDRRIISPRWETATCIRPALAQPRAEGGRAVGGGKVAAVRCGVGGMGTLIFPTRVAFGNDAKRVSHAAKRVWQKTHGQLHTATRKNEIAKASLGLTEALATM